MPHTAGLHRRAANIHTNKARALPPCWPLQHFSHVYHLPRRLGGSVSFIADRRPDLGH